MKLEKMAEINNHIEQNKSLTFNIVTNKEWEIYLRVILKIILGYSPLETTEKLHIAPWNLIRFTNSFRLK